MAWDDERVEQLKKLWAEGLSASQIANKMGGVTRNAVIGKVHRLGLSGRATPSAPQRGRSYGAPEDTYEVEEETSAVEASEPPVEQPVFSAPVTIIESDRATVASLRRNMCRWPIGDPASDDFHFCGEPTASGKSYCAYHAQLAFQPTQRRGEAAEPARERLAPPAQAPRRAVG
ncbi:MAG: GcrA family cell cycle regulator [Pseudomonadota bacterium]